MDKYYEAHIVRLDGSRWCGHTGKTQEEALEQAGNALGAYDPEAKEARYSRMEVFECTRVDTIIPKQSPD